MPRRGLLGMTLVRFATRPSSLGMSLQHNTAAAVATFADTAIVHWQSQSLDIPHYQQVGEMFLAGFPDIAYQLEEQFVAGDKVITCGWFGGTNTGSLMGMPVTGQPFRAASILIDRVVDGKIVERWELGDILGLMQQIGLVPVPQA
jgi:predicted ester cyclase